VSWRHYYKRPEIQDVADLHRAHSLELSRQAAARDAEVMSSVAFTSMAETAKILSPPKWC